jgi:GPH family glycoside/pentoside/hexuronide:cation symporter
MAQSKANLPKLPLWRGILYSSGNMSSQLLQWSFGMFLTYYYCSQDNPEYPPLLKISIVSTALFIGRFVDGFLEPIVGYFSDRTRTRWGRRMPFIMFGGLPMCAFFLLMWFPPFPPNTLGTALWLIVIQTFFWLCITLVFCPYLALLGEIVRTSEERILLSQLMQIFLLVGTGVVMALPAFFEPIRAHPQMFIIIAAMGFVSIYAVVLGVPETKYCGEHEADHYSIMDALKWTFTNKAFLIFVISSLFMLLGFQTLMNGLMFVITVLLRLPESYLPLLFGIIVISIVISFVIIFKLADKYTKKFVYSLGNGMMALILPFMFILDRIPIHWVNLNLAGLSLKLPLTWGYAVFFLTGFPVAVIMCMGLPIIADIADYDEKLYGKRREAIFFGAQGFLQKYAIAFTFLIQGFLFERYGYSMENNMGVKLLGPVTGVFVLIGFFIFLFYPLNERTLQLDDTPAARLLRRLTGKK